MAARGFTIAVSVFMLVIGAAALVAYLRTGTLLELGGTSPKAAFFGRLETVLEVAGPVLVIPLMARRGRSAPEQPVAPPHVPAPSPAGSRRPRPSSPRPDTAKATAKATATTTTTTTTMGTPRRRSRRPAPASDRPRSPEAGVQVRPRGPDTGSQASSTTVLLRCQALGARQWNRMASSRTRKAQITAVTPVVGVSASNRMRTATMVAPTMAGTA